MVVTGGDVRPQVQATDETYIYDVEAGVWTPGTLKSVFFHKTLQVAELKIFLVDQLA